MNPKAPKQIQQVGRDVLGPPRALSARSKTFWRGAYNSNKRSMVRTFNNKDAYRFMNLLFPLLALVITTSAVELKSPDRKIRFNLERGQNGLVYQVDFNNKPVIESSPIVIQVDGATISEG